MIRFGLSPLIALDCTSFESAVMNARDRLVGNKASVLSTRLYKLYIYVHIYIFTADCLLSNAMLVSQLKLGGFAFPWCAHGKKSAQLAICSSHANKWNQKGMHENGFGPKAEIPPCHSLQIRPASGAGFSLVFVWWYSHATVRWASNTIYAEHHEDSHRSSLRNLPPSDE